MKQTVPGRSVRVPAVLMLAVGLGLSSAKAAQQQQGGFRWVNPLQQQIPGVKHATFRSPSMDCEVGYCIYLPPQYESGTARYPVVYYLHGGRPGNETKSVRLARFFHQHISTGAVKPMIYVFVNGGPVSHYNVPGRPDAQGADVFIRELIPHIDRTYRTIADRSGRGLEGFSQGGRGTARLMFRYPELFATAAPGGAGQATEKLISEREGRENEHLVFAQGDNTWDLARQYAMHPDPPLRILFHVGTKGFNYQNNLEYMQLMDSLKIPFDQVVVEGAGHSAQQIYAAAGQQIMKFHEAGLQHPADATKD
jgi:enterochelin esterase-like enzyme